jgi:hypothetical protein
LSAFDLLELDGKDLRREPIEVRKATLASLLRSCRSGMQFNQHLAYPGDVVFQHACKMGLEGIVSKRLGSRYTSGRWAPPLLRHREGRQRSADSPAEIAVKRVAEQMSRRHALGRRSSEEVHIDGGNVRWIRS